MTRFLVLLLLLVLPAAAFARCGGTNLIDAMSADARARLQGRADAMPFAEGLLWQAERDGTRYILFGTYHFRHPRTDAHLAALRGHMAAADAIYLEMSATDRERAGRAVAEDPSIMFITRGPTLPDLLGEDDWKMLAAALSLRGFPPFMVAKFKPIHAALMLGIGPCEAQSGALENPGIDERIGAEAADLGIHSRSLEDFRTAMQLLDDIPQALQIDMIRLFLDWDLDPDDISHTLREAYLAQKVGLFWEYGRKLSLDYGGPTAEADFALFEELLLTRRNADWLKLLKEQGVTGNILVAVGAAHLPGQTGLLRLLEQDGYSITRLPFDP